VRDSRYRYILNLTPEATFQNAATSDPTFKTWQTMAASGDAHAKRLVHDYQQRSAEELYDCEADPWNRTNLIADEKLTAVRDELRAKLDAWMKQQGDEGQATEMKALERMPRGARARRPPRKRRRVKRKSED
jgi:N-sulfoglucosamine sulfohydrolase